MRKEAAQHRLNLVLGPRAYAALEQLQEAFEAHSQVETVRLSLLTMSQLVGQMQNGARLILHENGGMKTELILPSVIIEIPHV